MQPIMLDGIEVKVGSRMFDVMSGWGTVESRAIDGWCAFRVVFDDRGLVCYKKDGSPSGAKFNRSLFWNEVTITPPAPPKKMVKVWDWFILFHSGDARFCKEFSEKSVKKNWPSAKIHQRIDGTEQEIEQ